jgi:hypothetical protein
MAVSIAYRIAGPAFALSVANTAHAAVAITDSTNDLVTYVSAINRGATDVVVSFYPLSAAGVAQAPTITFPVDGTPTTIAAHILPASMTQPIVLAVPNGNNGTSVTAIGSAAGPSIIYITPVSIL